MLLCLSKSCVVEQQHLLGSRILIAVEFIIFYTMAVYGILREVTEYFSRKTYFRLTTFGDTNTGLPSPPPPRNDVKRLVNVTIFA